MTAAPVGGVTRTATYPALPAQLGMLFETLAHPHEGRYVQQLVAELREPLDPNAMEAAWRWAVARNAVLRTGFRLEDPDAPLQEVQEELDMPIAHLDWRHLRGRERERELAALLGDDRALGYEPSRPPLSRLALCRFDDADWRLVWSYHHALLDGRSRLAVLREVFAHYDAHRGGEAVEVPPGPDFGDFARWVADLDVVAALEFWRRELRGFAEPTPLPVRPATGSEAEPGTLAREIDAAAVAGLRALAEREEVTLGVVLQAAWALLLARETGARDVLFGAVRAGRRSAPFDTEGMVGLLNATVPVRARIDPAAELGGWLRELRARWVEMRPWEHTALVDTQRVSEISPPAPLFRTLFSFERHTTDSALGALGGPFAHRRFELHERLAYPLTASLYEQGDCLLVKLLYDGEEVDTPGAERVAVLYTELLKELAAGDAGSLERLLAPSDAAPGELNPAWNDTARPYERDAPIGELLAAAADREPGAVAVIDGERRLSYGELDRAANRLANRLLELGVEHETRVALAMRRSLELVVAMAGVIRAGAAYVPLDPDHPRERLEYMLCDSGARALLTDEVERPPGGALPTIVLDPELRAIAGASEQAPEVEAGAGSLAYVIYTSGSTGRPKGVAVEHRAVVRLVRGADYLQVDPSDVVAQASNASFDAATFEVWGALLNGASLAIVPTETTLSPRTLVARIADDRITVLFLTTQLFGQIAREAPEAFSPLRCLLFGGEAVDPRWVRRALEAGRPGRLLHVYGPTESTTFATWHEVEKVAEAGPVPIGLPIANTRAYVLDSGRRAVPVGVTGELYLGGDGLARGYLGQPELTAERFVADPFGDGEERLYRTGDLVRRSDDGALEFIGRVDDQVKIRGFRVEPAEVEAVLSEHPGVVACSVAGREHAGAGKQLVAWIVPSADHAPGPHELRGFARLRLPEHMVPAAVVTIDALPLTRHGKVDRAALPEPAADPGQAEEYSPPRSELERELVTIWEEALEIRPIGVTDNFFDLGGHSLLALRVFAEIDRRLGRALSPGTIFQAPTIERLAAVVAMEGTWEPLVPVQEGGSRRPFFCVHPGAGYAVHFANLARHLGPDRPFFALQVQRLDDSGPVYTPIVEETAARYLQEVRRVQPDGPYLLGGQCFGGIIAFEMAQQLVDAGEEVAMLLVFDSGVPPAVAAKPARAAKPKVARPGLKAKRGARKRAGAVVRRRRRAVRTWWRALGRMERKRHARDSALLSLMARARALFGDPESDRERQIVAAHRRAKRLYMPRVYPGRVTLIRSSEFATRSDKETHLLWANLAGGGFESEVVEGRHQTFFKEPHVKRLAERVRACVYRAELEADGD